VSLGQYIELEDSRDYKRTPDKVDHEGTDLKGFGKENSSAIVIIPVPLSLSARVHTHIDEAAERDDGKVGSNNTPPSLCVCLQIFS